MQEDLPVGQVQGGGLDGIKPDGQLWLDFDIWLSFGSVCPDSANFEVNSTELGSASAKFGLRSMESVAMAVKSSPDSDRLRANFGGTRANFGRNLGISQLQANFGRNWPSVSGIGQERGRTRPSLGRR